MSKLVAHELRVQRLLVEPETTKVSEGFNAVRGVCALPWRWTITNKVGWSCSSLGMTTSTGFPTY